MIAWISLKSASGFIILNGMLLTWKVILKAISRLKNHYVKGLPFETPVRTSNGKKMNAFAFTNYSRRNFLSWIHYLHIILKKQLLINIRSIIELGMNLLKF